MEEYVFDQKDNLVPWYRTKTTCQELAGRVNFVLQGGHLLVRANACVAAGHGTRRARRAELGEAQLKVGGLSQS